MPLSPSLIWEVRPTGSAANSGGFRAGATGTDYSQSDAPHASFSDLAINAADAAKVSSATVGFAADHVGNTLRVSGGTGFTTGVYEILSVSAGVATLDRGCGTTGSTGGTGTLGGALDSPKALESVAVAGNTIWVKSGTYSMGSQGLSLSQGSTTLVGYDATRGDLDAITASPNRPWIQPAAGWSVSISGSGHNVIANLKIAHASGSTHAGLSAGGRNNLVRNCQVVGPFTQTGVRIPQGYGTVESCEVSGDAPIEGISVNMTSTVRGCHVHDITTGDGIGSGDGTTITGNIVTSIAGAGIRHRGTSTTPPGPLTYNTIHDCGGDGVACQSLGGSTVIRGNLISTCGGAGISNDSQVGFRPTWDGNAFWSVTGAPLANLDGPSAFAPTRNLTLTANPFMDAASGDFRLNASPGGGPTCRGSAPEGAWPGLAHGGSRDMGAIPSTSGGLVSGNSYFWLEG